MKFLYSHWPLWVLWPWLALSFSYAFYFLTVSAAYEIYRTYFARPRRYQRLFSKPTYWLRRSRGQCGEQNIQAGIVGAEGNESLIAGRLARSPLSLYFKSVKRKLSVSALQTLESTVREEVVGGGHRNDILDFFPPGCVHSHIAQVNRPKILERMVFGSSPLCCKVFDSLFHFAHFDLTKTRAILIKTSSLIKKCAGAEGEELVLPFSFSNWRLRKFQVFPVWNDEETAAFYFRKNLKYWTNTGHYWRLVDCMRSNGSRALLTCGSGKKHKCKRSILDLQYFCSIQFFMCVKRFYLKVRRYDTAVSKTIQRCEILNVCACVHERTLARACVSVHVG